MMPGGMSVLLATEPVDMRRSFDGLARTVKEQLGRDFAGERTMFLFVNRRRDMLKLFWRDSTGWCLLCKRLDDRVVQLPTNIPDGATSVAIDARALAALLDGAVRPRREGAKDVVRAARAAFDRHQKRATDSRNSTTSAADTSAE